MSCSLTLKVNVNNLFITLPAGRSIHVLEHYEISKCVLVRPSHSNNTDRTRAVRQLDDSLAEPSLRYDCVRSWFRPNFHHQ